MLPAVLARVGALGAGVEDGIREISTHRANLVDVAWRCHAESAFGASIPIVLAQIEGICFDVSGKAFFSKDPMKQAEVTDEVTLAGLDLALGATRDALSIDVPVAGAANRRSMTRLAGLFGAVCGCLPSRLHPTVCAVRT